MSSRTKKICLLFCGGTAIDDYDLASGSISGPSDINSWLRKIPELGLVANLKSIFVTNGRDNLTPLELWKKTGRLIAENYYHCDGFVITAEVSQAHFLALALSFSLENLDKPAMITGSQITPENLKLADWPLIKKKAYGGLGIKANLINAVQVATMNVPAVGLMFGSRLVRAVKAQRTQAVGLNIFSSADESYLAKIDFGITLTEKFVEPAGQFNLRNNFTDRLSVIDYFPGWQPTEIFAQSPQTLLIRDLPGFEIFKKQKFAFPVVVYNRSLLGEAKNNNIYLINNLTWETAIIKIIWALAQKEELAEILSKEYCKEFIK